MPDIFTLATLGVSIGSLVLNIIIMGKFKSVTDDLAIVLKRLNDIRKG